MKPLLLFKPNPRAFKKPEFSFVTVQDTAERLVIRDLDMPGNRSLTNAADDVVALLAPVLDGRPLYYYDSDGQLDQMLVKDGRFAGFKAGGPAKDSD